MAAQSHSGCQAVNSIKGDKNNKGNGEVAWHSPSAWHHPQQRLAAETVPSPHGERGGGEGGWVAKGGGAPIPQLPLPGRCVSVGSGLHAGIHPERGRALWARSIARPGHGGAPKDTERTKERHTEPSAADGESPLQAQAPGPIRPKAHTAPPIPQAPPPPPGPRSRRAVQRGAGRALTGGQRLHGPGPPRQEPPQRRHAVRMAT